MQWERPDITEMHACSTISNRRVIRRKKRRNEIDPIGTMLFLE